ncbi:MMPL family transporter [Streptomyces microflavus]|uniref:MMPL family transporter n=1 Tax=Streptomyces microflavus TaxID=1919 RepID=UPI0029BC6C6B|nr:MMPL family transporter [Streptomyces microflavus]MDX2403325.1 MMPL family transporter [Streptomyces microflavus]
MTPVFDRLFHAAPGRAISCNVRRRNSTANRRAKTAEEIAPEVTGDQGSLEVKSGGCTEFNRQADESVEKDLLTAQSTAVPTTLLVLILVFRSGAAALLPLTVAGVSVVGSPATPVVVAQFTSVSVFTTNLTTALVLGLATAHRATLTGRADGRRRTRPHPRHLRAMVFTLGPGTAPAIAMGAAVTRVPPVPTRCTANRSGPGAGERRSATKP